MTITFQSLLEEAEIPLNEVALLRHRPQGGIDPLALWRSGTSAFEAYQSFQLRTRRAHFRRPIWAAFAAAGGSRSAFLGLYEATLLGAVDVTDIDPVGGVALNPEIHDRYTCVRREALSEYCGRLFVDWGRSPRAWVQRGTSTKPITELRADGDEGPEFPGYISLVTSMSEVSCLPEKWVYFLKQGRGVYLLTCPTSGKTYVGKADGNGGFWSRWIAYAADGHGGNTRLKSRERTNYRISILEVAGSGASEGDILRMEERWKQKLMSREWGLNAN